MTEQAAPPTTGLIRVSAPVRRRLLTLLEQRQQELGRMVTMSEVLEQLLDSYQAARQ